MPISQAASDLGLGGAGLGLNQELEDELKRRKKDQGKATDQNPGTYGFSAAATELFGSAR